MSFGSSSLLAALALGAVATAAAPAFAQASPVAGTWDLTMSTPIGERKSTMVVTSTGQTVTVSFVLPAGAEPAQDTVSEIRIEGSSFAFKRLVEIDQGQIEMNYAGTVDGDVLSGKVKSQFGEFDLKGSRAN